MKRSIARWVALGILGMSGFIPSTGYAGEIVDTASNPIKRYDFQPGGGLLLELSASLNITGCSNSQPLLSMKTEIARPERLAAVVVAGILENKRMQLEVEECQDSNSLPQFINVTLYP